MKDLKFNLKVDAVGKSFLIFIIILLIIVVVDDSNEPIPIASGQSIPLVVDECQ